MRDSIDDWAGQHRPSWWEKRKYGDGAQAWPKSCESFYKQRFRQLTLYDLAVLEALTWFVWKTKDWEVVATPGFISEGLGDRISAQTVTRCIGHLRKWGYLKLVELWNPRKFRAPGRPPGNRFLVSSGLMRIADAEILRNYVDARRLFLSAEARTDDQNDHLSKEKEATDDQIDHHGRSKRSSVGENACLTDDQIDHHDLDPILFLEDASRHRCPNGHDQGKNGTGGRRGPGTKRSRLSAAAFEEKRKEMLARLTEQAARDELAKKDREPAIEGEKSNFRAEA